MKPILVDNCEHFDGRKSECTKCGRSLPDVCLEFEQMKQKAEAYELLLASKDSPTRPSVQREDGTGSHDKIVETIEAPQEPKKARGRPRKQVNEKNATD